MGLLHRKVVSYDDWVDASDEPGGHGTHVVGSIVANDPFSAGANSRGSAPGEIFKYLWFCKFPVQGARVSFMDLGDSSGSLWVPADLTNGPINAATTQQRPLHHSVGGPAITAGP